MNSMAARDTPTTSSTRPIVRSRTMERPGLLGDGVADSETGRPLGSMLYQFVKLIKRQKVSVRKARADSRMAVLANAEKPFSMLPGKVETIIFDRSYYIGLRGKSKSAFIVFFGPWETPAQGGREAPCPRSVYPLPLYPAKYVAPSGHWG